MNTETRSSPTPIARLEAVSMQYGKVHALSQFDLRLDPGEAICVLGPNGAGKTTALKLLTGLKRTQKGRAILFGGNPRAPRSRRKIGVTPQEAAFPHGLKVRELLNFARDHYPRPADLEEIVEAFDLAPLMNRMAIALSGDSNANWPSPLPSAVPRMWSSWMNRRRVSISNPGAACGTTSCATNRAADRSS